MLEIEATLLLLNHFGPKFEEFHQKYIQCVTIYDQYMQSTTPKIRWKMRRLLFQEICYQYSIARRYFPKFLVLL